jgi:hypothetical protein
MRFLTYVVGLPLLAVLVWTGFTSRSGVEAGTALRMELAELVRRAELILEVRVLQARAVERDGWIETDYLLEVARSFDGPDEPYRVVRLPGGTLPDGRGMVLAGMPRLVQGEEALLFLSAEGPTGARVPVGLAQGKLDVERSQDGTRRLVRDAGGVLFVNKDGAIVQGEGRQVFAYADVVARIEAALATKRGR